MVFQCSVNEDGFCQLKKMIKVWTISTSLSSSSGRARLLTEDLSVSQENETESLVTRPSVCEENVLKGIHYQNISLD